MLFSSLFKSQIVVAELQLLHPLEKKLGANVSGLLALRMLYCSVSSKSHLSYHRFLTGMDRCLLHSLEPLDVLYFWQQAGAIGVGTAWMAVFAIDQVCMQSTWRICMRCACLLLHTLIQIHTASQLPVPVCWLISLYSECLCNKAQSLPCHKFCKEESC